MKDPAPLSLSAKDGLFVQKKIDDRVLWSCCEGLGPYSDSGWQHSKTNVSFWIQHVLLPMTQINNPIIQLSVYIDFSPVILTSGYLDWKPLILFLLKRQFLQCWPLCLSYFCPILFIITPRVVLWFFKWMTATNQINEWNHMTTVPQVAGRLHSDSEEKDPIVLPLQWEYSQYQSLRCLVTNGILS